MSEKALKETKRIYKQVIRLYLEAKKSLYSLKIYTAYLLGFFLDYISGRYSFFPIRLYILSPRTFRLELRAFRLIKKGRYKEATHLFKRLLEIREKVFGKDHPNVALNLVILAALYFLAGRYSEIEPLNDRSLKIAETIGNRLLRYLIVSSVSYRRGRCYEKEENWSAAIVAYQRARAYFNPKRMFEVKHRKYVEIGWRLALCLKKADRWLEALAVQEENFKAYKKLGDLKNEADVYMEIGHLHQLLDNYEESWLHYLDAYRLYSRANDGKGDKVGMASASEALGTLEFYARMLTQSVKDLEEAHDLYKSLDLPDKVATVEKTLKRVRKALKEEELVTV
jgi:tetratricopeptide (TPR) repeat protein